MSILLVSNVNTDNVVENKGRLRDLLLPRFWPGGNDSKNCSEYFSDRKEKMKIMFFEIRFKRPAITFHNILTQIFKSSFNCVFFLYYFRIPFIINLVARKNGYLFLNNSWNKIICNKTETRNNKQKSIRREQIHILY